MKKILFCFAFLAAANASCNTADECFVKSVKIQLLKNDCAKKEKFSCQILNLFSLKSIDEIDINALLPILENSKNYEKYLDLNALNKSCQLGQNLACAALMLYLNKDNKELIANALQALKAK